MVRGLDVFTRFFADFTDRYVLIGGVASAKVMDEAGLAFRATKDLDIVLIIEALDTSFAEVFWQFIAAGHYQIAQRSGGAPQFYRFQKPQDESFPFMLELFSRIPDGMVLMPGAELSPIPADEAVSSLSAILLDEDYYNFIVSGRQVADGLSFIGPERLIPLKANAWLDLSRRKLEGQDVDSRNIKKHRNDVLRISQLLSPAAQIGLPGRVAADLDQFLTRLAHENIDLKQLNISGGDLPTLIARIRQSFKLTA